MKISFIIPAYNEEDYIGDCVRSILSHAHSTPLEVEVVVVNNASTDQTRAIASAFKGVKVIDEPTKGITFARQAGFANATGDLIANIDADSLLTDGWMDQVYEEFSKDKDLIALSGPCLYHEQSHVRQLMIRLYYYCAYAIYWLNRFVFKFGSMIQGANSVIRRSALEKVGGYNTGVEFYGEDTDLAKRLHSVGPVKFSLNLQMYTSSRRLAGEGMFMIAIRYPLNYFWTILFNRPFTKTYRDIRD